MAETGSGETATRLDDASERVGSPFPWDQPPNLSFKWARTMPLSVETGGIGIVGVGSLPRSRWIYPALTVTADLLPSARSLGKQRLGMSVAWMGR